ncbi:MAG: MoaD/ThiS family protein [Isosphaeraceae bacterium]|nr:MoaD/ThiS family protein [Isosphaeraceae bacterium]
MDTGPAHTIAIELYGVPRLKAGCARVEIEARTLSEALLGLARQCPALAGSVIDGTGGIRPAYRVSLNGERFVTDPETPLARNDVVLVLAADVGG